MYYTIKAAIVSGCFNEDFSPVPEGRTTEWIFHPDLDQNEITTKSIGDAPVQVLDFDELMSKNPAATSGGEDYEDDFYGSDGYNDEDLDGLDLDNIADVSSIDDLY